MNSILMKTSRVTKMLIFLFHQANSLFFAKLYNPNRLWRLVIEQATNSDKNSLSERNHTVVATIATLKLDEPIELTMKLII